ARAQALEMVVLWRGHGSEHSHVDQLGVAEYRVQGGSELVAPRGEEVTLSAIRHLRIFLRPLGDLARFDRSLQRQVALTLGVFARCDVGMGAAPLLYLSGRLEYGHRSRKHLEVVTAARTHAVLQFGDDSGRKPLPPRRPPP